DQSQGVLVIWNREKTSFLVDRMYNHQKIVVRRLPESYKQFRDVPGISGYTVLGNEEIVLIIDPADVAHRATTDVLRRALH
ncbi:MAG: chemotaxis protein CheW, partial [Deltaproteobacteria bacterium]